MGRPLLFYTSRIDFDGEDRVSVARQRTAADSREGLEFAPSWDLLLPAIKLRKEGLETEESWAAYAAAYLAEMRRSYATARPAWDRLLSRPRAVLCCFCNLNVYPGRCHRLLLADMLRKCGAVYLGEWCDRLSDEERSSQYRHWLDLGAAEGGAVC